MTSSEIRERFLRAFEQRGHRRVRSSSLVPASDPTLLFTNAGMNQFKQVFLGLEKRDYTRAASSQKCLRVSGKHNDLEQVGRTPRHHTFFEMLGNFSFGDYFKREAILYGWDILTGEYGLDKGRLWATVFGGEGEIGPDREAEDTWLRAVGIPPERFRRYGASDNFWSMGETGPCGPCSEIHWDNGPSVGCGRPECEPSCPCGRFVELWNLVFMESQKAPDGTLEPLPRPSIDTGMGLERLCMVLQGVASNYETDLFQPIIASIEAMSGVRHGASPESDVSIRVIADHLRAIAFLVADGVMPSNEKRGYVLRRLVRRAAIHGQWIRLEPPFLHGLTGTVADVMKGAYPELLEGRDHIAAVVSREEEQFARTLAVGVRLLEEVMEKVRQAAGTEGREGEAREAGGALLIPGSDLFRLYDTFGLPLDFARDLAEHEGMTLDEAGFELEMERQRERARRSWTGAAPAAPPAAFSVIPEGEHSRFIGYSDLSVEDARVVAIAKDGASQPRLVAGEEGEVLLDVTPFYAASGGQVGDIGILAGPRAGVRVAGTGSPGGGMIIHRVHVEEGELEVGDRVRAEVDRRARLAAMRNHTATHLLHASLREILGTHVKQAGSLVAPERLRFDFTHFQGVEGAALAAVEDLVNEKILEDLPVETEIVSLDQAVHSGAMALFGEKYGERVRVCRIGDFSLELCGGTHTSRTGQIGVFKFASERGVSAGVRRVEALTGEGALKRFQEDAGLLRQMESLLNLSRGDLIPGIGRRLSVARELQKEIEQLRSKLALEPGAVTEEKSLQVEGHKIVARRADGLSGPEMRLLADSIKKRIGTGVVILGKAEEGKATLLVAVTPDLAGKLRAGELAKALGPLVGGRGGGKAELAEAGGKDPSGVEAALEAGLDRVSSLLQSMRGGSTPAAGENPV